MRYEVNLTGVQTAREMHEAIRAGLDLPEYYGMNLDALWDVLTGEVETPCGIHVRVGNAGTEMMEALIEAVIGLMREAAEWHGERGRAMEIVVEE